MTGEPKTGDRMFELIKDDIKFMHDKYGVDTIAWASDDGPDGKKARRLIDELLPTILAIVCWAHQLNLVVGDYLRGTRYLDIVNQALDVIRWFNGHSAALDLFHREQLNTYNDRTQALVLILPTITRWTAHYLSVCRLLLVSLALRTCCMKYRDQLLMAGGKQHKFIEEAEQILDIVKNDQFWVDLVRCAPCLSSLFTNRGLTSLSA